MNPDRQVLPGLFYRLPAPPDKLSPFAVEQDAFQRMALSAGDTPGGHMAGEYLQRPAALDSPGAGVPGLRQRGCPCFADHRPVRQLFCVDGVYKG